MKLALGTAQFGLDYGISNTTGQVPLNTARQILDRARQHGIDTIDTASLYGCSEETLSRLDLEGFRIITKTPKLNHNLDTKDNLELFTQAFARSRRYLGSSLYGVMFHEADDLLRPEGRDLWDFFVSCRATQHITKIGVSVYSPAQLERILRLVEVDIVQIPLNLLDQRFVYLLPELKRKNIEIHSRSAFLQGLLLMDVGSLDDYFAPIVPVLERIPEPRLASAISYPAQIPQIDRIVVGCTTATELEQICYAYNNPVTEIDFPGYRVDDELFINPSRWSSRVTT